MRAALLALLAASCSPDIGAGAYFCGTDSLCPDGFACDGPSNTCVLPAAVQPFTCGTGSDANPEHEPDDDASGAFAVPALHCVPTAVELLGCLHDGDPADYISFTVPDGCALQHVTLEVDFETAFAEVGLSVDGDQTADAACDASSLGESARCLTIPITDGTTYDVSIAPTGSDDCGGDCAFNRYSVSISLN